MKTKNTFEKLDEIIKKAPAGSSELYKQIIKDILILSDIKSKEPDSEFGIKFGAKTLNYEKYSGLINELVKLQGFEVKINRNKEYFIESASITFLDNVDEYDEIYDKGASDD